MGFYTEQFNFGEGGGPVLETNGVPNGDQSLLNLVEGSNITIEDDGFGNITISSTGGGESLWEQSGSTLSPIDDAVDTLQFADGMYILANGEVGIQSGGNFNFSYPSALGSMQIYDTTLALNRLILDNTQSFFGGTNAFLQLSEDGSANYLNMPGSLDINTGTGSYIEIDADSDHAGLYAFPGDAGMYCQTADFSRQLYIDLYAPDENGNKILLYSSDPSTTVVDVSTMRIVNVQDPINPLDAVNLQTLEANIPSELNIQTFTASYDLETAHTVDLLNGSGAEVIVQLPKVSDTIKKEYTFVRTGGDAGNTVKLLPFTEAGSTSRIFVAHFKLNDNAADTNVLENIAFYNGTSSQNTEDISVTGKINNAFTFNGSTDKVTTGVQYLNGSSVSICAWAKPASDGSGFHWIVSQDDGGWDWGLLRLDGNWSLSTGSNFWNSGSAIAIGDWQHLIGIWDADAETAYLYVNGSLVGSTSISPSSSGNFMWIGAGPNVGGEGFFDGDIDDVRIYNYVLSAGEIAQIFEDFNGTENEDNLILHLLMNDNADNTIVADNVFSNNGIASANTDTLTTTGKINNALNFNGTDTMVTVNTGFVLNDFSIAMWIKPSDISIPAEYLFCIPSAYIFYIEPATSSVGFYDGSPVLSATMLSNDTWQHVIVTREADQLKFYINGVLDANVYTVAQTEIDISQFFISDDGSGDRRYIGDIDDYRIYNKALSQADVDALYTANTGTEDENNLVAHYTLNDNSDDMIVVDVRNEAYNATASVNTEDMSTTGKINEAFHFGDDISSGNWVTCPDMGTIQNQFTIAYWFTIASGQTQSKHFGSRNGAGNTTDGGIDDLSTYHCDIGNGTTWLSTAVTASYGFADDGTWYHVAVSVKETGATIYINGVFNSTTTWDSDSPLCTDSARVMAIGTYSSDAHDYNTAGDIDDFRIYNVALDAGEIADIYNAGSGTEDELRTRQTVTLGSGGGSSDNIAGLPYLTLENDNSSVKIVPDLDEGTTWRITASHP